MLITVSNCNFNSLLSAKNNETVIVEHIGSNQRVILKKIGSGVKPKRMSLEDIEDALGFPIELIEND